MVGADTGVFHLFDIKPRPEAATNRAWWDRFATPGQDAGVANTSAYRSLATAAIHSPRSGTYATLVLVSSAP
jgi:hypothetical protein